MVIWGASLLAASLCVTGRGVAAVNGPAFCVPVHLASFAASSASWRIMSFFSGG